MMEENTQDGRGKMRFSVGYNQDMSMLKILEKYREHIEYFYFPVPSSLAGSGRLEHHKNDYKDNINVIIKKCRNLGIKSMLLLNSICDGKMISNRKYMAEVVEYISGMHRSGLDSVCITNLLYLSFIRDAMPSIEIHASVNCYVKNVNHAVYLKDLGVDAITIDRDINYNLGEIKAIKKATGLKITMLVNEGCLSNCPYRNTHYNQIAHIAKDEQSEYLYRNACLGIYDKHPELVLKSPAIRPEDLLHYKGLVDVFKIASRKFSAEEIKLLLNAYTEGRYEGNFLDLLSNRNLRKMMNIDNKKIEGLFAQKIKCRQQSIENGCGECKICREFYEKAKISRIRMKGLDKKIK